MIQRKKPMYVCAKCDHKKHARACKTCTCAYRSTAAKPVKARNPKRRPAELASAQRAAVMERDDYRCAFEVMYGDWGWVRCNTVGNQLQTCHVIRRRTCGDAIYHPDVAIAGCVACHDRFDRRANRGLNVRVPEQMLSRAIAAVKAAEARRAEAGRAVVPLPPKYGEAS